MIKPRIDDIMELTIIPERIRTRLLRFLKKAGIAMVTATAIRPPAKAKTEIDTDVSDRRIAMAAPIQAPLETPKKSGETRGFWKIP